MNRFGDRARNGAVNIDCLKVGDGAGIVQGGRSWRQSENQLTGVRDHTNTKLWCICMEKIDV